MPSTTIVVATVGTVNAASDFFTMSVPAATSQYWKLLQTQKTSYLMDSVDHRQMCFENERGSCGSSDNEDARKICTPFQNETWINNEQHITEPETMALSIST